MDKNNSKVKGLVSRTLSFMLAFVMVATAVLAGAGGFREEAYAKAIRAKNQQACDNCEAVRDGKLPKDKDGNDYEKLLGGAVYRGGNSHSGVEGVYIDNDPNDFANPLPYGNVFVDTSRLSWSTPSNFTIDIKDDRFKWVAVDGKQFTDSKGTKTTNDPLGSGKPLAGRTPKDGGGLDEGAIFGGFIAYVGELKPYHSDIKAKADGNGYTNTFKAPEGDYLYRITYRDAATLADGTKGNLIMTMTQVDIETSMSVSKDNPRVLKDKNGNEYEYTKAVMPIQGANTLRVASGVVDSEGNWVNEPYTVVLTSDEVQTAVNAANDNLPKKEDKISAGMVKDKAIRHTAGAAYTFDIQVVDSEGNPADGTMAYAAKDLDLPSYQNIWGRESADPFMYSEGLSIITGSQSYALVPEYNHSNATTLASGWVANGLSGSWDSPLDIKAGSGSGTNANGVSFRSNGEKVLRDQNGLWKDSFFSWNENSSDELMALPDGSIRDFMWNNINAARLRDKANLSTTALDNNVKKQLAGKVKDGSGNSKAWDQITAADAVAYINDGSYAVERNDANDSYDTGFAVLLDPAKATFRWTGSSYNSGSAVTTLFDSTLFTYIEQTHGTGGGIYFETYDISDKCKVNRAEGMITMGTGDNATVTVVPEDGHRVMTIMVGGKGLSDPKEYKVAELSFTDGKYEDSDNGVTIEKNADGTYDVTLANVDDPRHVHVDFTADYYFNKVWQLKKEPTSLKLTATPYFYQAKEVTIKGVKYTVDGDKYTDPNGKTYTIDNYKLIVGEGSKARTYQLRGNKLVHYDRSDPDNPKIDEEYIIIQEFVKAGESKSFDVVKADADDASETHVIQETNKDGFKVWKIRYPAEGYTTKSGKTTWPAMPIEAETDSHAKNHDNRLYWFVTEDDAPGWELAGYDNSTAEIPGKVETAKNRKEAFAIGESGNLSAWAEASVKNYDQAKKEITSAEDHAYMSVFSNHEDAITKHNSWGGMIINGARPPVGTPKETYGLKNSPQSVSTKDMFKVTTEKLEDGSPNKIEKVELLDENGNPAKTVKVKGGTYTMSSDGTITFTPDKDFVGNPPPVTVRGTDSNGLSAETTYTPHVVDPVSEDTATRKIYYTYLTEDGDEASDTITQSIKIKRHAKKIDPATGKVLEWGPWESATFPAVPNPGNVDEAVWTANKSAQAATVTKPGPAEDVHIVYTKEPYTVKYFNGAHGKSDRKGDQSGEDYGNKVTGGNGVTPDKGWHFTGKYTYVIKDKNGKVIKTGETDDPTSVEIIGNVEFTPLYEPNRYTIKYDANGGNGSMDDQIFSGTDEAANSKENQFTREGYEFIGFKAMLPDGTYVKDIFGNDIIFKNVKDFIEMLHELGDGAEITLVAQWVPKGFVDTSDNTMIIAWVVLLAAVVIALAAFIIRRMRNN